MTFAVLRQPSRLPPRTAVCIGAFDGMHRGHQALLAAARSHADRVGLVTFDPHPGHVINPARAPKLLQNATQRERVLAALGVEFLVLLPFDEHTAAQSPEAFARETFVEGLRPQVVVVGEDFRFGAKRSGDAHLLRQQLAEHGIEVEIVAPILAAGGDGPVLHKLSSSDIRRCIDLGDLPAATRMLGRFHTVAGRVVHGDRRGRTLGFPTANIACDDAFLPPLGVYATYLVVWDRHHPDYRCVWPSASNLGKNPTFGPDTPPRLEVHVIDHDLGERLYDAEVEVAFVARLRDELRFESVDALVEQMHRDVRDAEQQLASAPSDAVIVPPP